MSNEISKFYQFLANQGQNWTEVADSKYGNDDGSVIKAEFKEFINAEWNGEEMGLDLTTDLVNQFWKKIDSNQSTSVIKGTNNIRNYNALDDKEVENMEKRIVAYQQFNEYSEEYIKSPGVFSSSDADWKNDVETDLMVHLEEWITNGCEGDLTEYLEQFRPAIESKYTAQYCAIEYQNELVDDVLKDYPDYKIADDSSLQDLISTYVKNISESEVLPDADSIKEEIREIIDAYFATAGLGSDSGYDLSTLGYAPKADSGLNDIQKEVITAKLKANLSDITSSEDYEKYQTLYDEAINSYISDIISSTKYGDFETVLNKGAEDFKSTDGYKNLMNRIEATAVLSDLSAGSDFYNAIVDTLGQTIADKLAIDYKFLDGAYDEIINQALEKVQNGEFLKTSNLVDSAAVVSSAATSSVDIDALLEWVTTQLAVNLNEIYSNGYGDMPIKELNSLYNKLFDEGMELADSDPDKAEQMIKDAALSYCEALSDKGNSMKNAVTEVFGDNYTTVINSANISDIKSLMEELIDKATEIGDISTYTATWTDTYNSYSMTTDSSLTINSAATVMNGTTPIDKSRITYSASFSGAGTGTINASTGEITVTGGATTGTITVKVSVLVDGVELGEPKTITIDVKTATFENANWRAGDSSSHIEAYGISDAGKQVTEYSFQDLYNSDAKIRLHIKMDKAKRNNKWETERQTVIDRLTQLGGYIKNALIDAGFSADILEKVIPTVISNYTSTCDTHKNNKGTSSDDLTNNCISYMSGIDCHNKIVNVVDTDWNDSNVYMISFKAFVDDIIAAYNAAANN